MFSCKYWTFDDSQIQEWQEAFPGISVVDELLRMRVWLDAHPEKHYKRWNRFVVGWLSRNHMKLLEAEVKGRAIAMQKDELAHREAMVGVGPRTGATQEAIERERARRAQR